MYEHPSVGSPVCSNKTRLNRLISGNKTLVARPTTYLSVPTTPTRGPRLLAVLCCCTTHQRKEKVKYRSEVVDRRRKRDVGSEVHVYRIFVEGRGELESWGGFWACALNTPSQGTTCTPVTTRRAPSFTSHSNHLIRISTHTSQIHSAQRPPYDGGWLETENKYLSEVPISTVFLHKTSSPTALISASQQRR